MSTSVRAAVIMFALGFVTVQPARSTTIIDFGESPVGPITNSVGSNGDFAGTEYRSLGIVFNAVPGDILNIGCRTGVGDPDNCLGADLGGTPDNFSGSLVSSFTLGSVDQVVDSVILDYTNDSTRTIIRAHDGTILLDQATGDVNFSDPGIASVESRFGADGIDTFTFGNLSPTVVPEPSTLAMTGAGILSLLGWAWRARGRAIA